MKWLAELLGIGGKILTAHTDLKRVKIEAEAKAIMKAAESTESWERMSAENAKNSWKDEFWTIVLAIPLILSFIPNLQPYVVLGFDALADVPDWYRWALMSAIGFAFARKALPDLASWKRR